MMTNLAFISHFSRKLTSLICLVFLFSFLLFPLGCKNDPTHIVMPGTDGINRITLRSNDDPRSLITQATLTAKLYCKSAKKNFRAIGREIFDRDSLKQQQIYNENLQHYPMPNEGYLEFTCL
jgi:hypothetical protein